MDHDVYCPSCGRDKVHDYACLHQKKLSIIEVITVYFLIILMPILMIPKDVLVSRWTWSSLIPSTSLSLVLILLGLTFLNITLNRPYLALFFGCHQQVHRSPKMMGKRWVLCMRCSGIYLGIFAMLISFWLIFPWWVYVLLSLPLIMDGLLQHISHYESTTIKRLLTGFLFGGALVFFINVMIYAMMRLSFWIVHLF